MKLQLKGDKTKPKRTVTALSNKRKRLSSTPVRHRSSRTPEKRSNDAPYKRRRRESYDSSRSSARTTLSSVVSKQPVYSGNRNHPSTADRGKSCPPPSWRNNNRREKDDNKSSRDGCEEMPSRRRNDKYDSRRDWSYDDSRNRSSSYRRHDKTKYNSITPSFDNGSKEFTNFESDVQSAYYGLVNNNVSTKNMKSLENFAKDHENMDYTFYENIVNFIEKLCGYSIAREILNPKNRNEAKEFINHCLCAATVGVLAGKYVYNQDMNFNHRASFSYPGLGLESRSNVKDILYKLFSSCAQERYVQLPTSQVKFHRRRPSSWYRHKKYRCDMECKSTPVKDETSSTSVRPDQEELRRFMSTREGQTMIQQAITNMPTSNTYPQQTATAAYTQQSYTTQQQQQTGQYPSTSYSWP